MAQFQKRDLMKPIDQLGKFDIIFCRNVAIYFSHANKVRLFKKLSHAVASGGSMIVGASETLSGVADAFEVKHYLNTLFYQLKKDDHTKELRDSKADNRILADRPKRKVKKRSTPKNDYHNKSPKALDFPVTSRKAIPEQKPRLIQPKVDTHQRVIRQAAKSDFSLSGEKRSLLASIGDKTQTKGSLLDTIWNNQSQQKKSLIQGIEERLENKKPETD